MVKVGGSKLIDNDEHFQKWLDKKNVGPLVIEVGVVHGCNHGCVHCSFQQFDKYGDYDFIQKDIFLKFLDDFKELGGVEVYFAGNGEPLLHPDICEFFEYGNKLGLDMSLSTNGAYLTPDIAKRIVPNAKWISFSVNGGNVADYTNIHKCYEDEFYKVLDNIKEAMNIKLTTFCDTRIIMQFIAYSLNVNSIEDIVKIAQEFKVDQLNIRSSIFQSNYNTFENRKLLEKIKKAEDVENVVIRWNSDINTKQWDKCYGINFRTNMDHKGNVYACNRELFLHDSSIGNISEKTFKEIWLSDEKKIIFDKVVNTEDKSKCMKWCQCSGDNMYIESYMKDREN